MGNIIDISEHQQPENIDYDKFCNDLDLAIVRIQYGSAYMDIYHKTHINEIQKRGIPVAVYAWVRGVSNQDMEAEAASFYNRAKKYNPTFWFLDIEEQSMENMRDGVEKYRAQLKMLGANKVGCYIAHHLYELFNLNLTAFDGIWIPHYGTNNGQPNSQPDYNCDLHQYTSVGRHSGYNYDLDFNQLTGSKPLNYFSNRQEETINPAAPTSHWIEENGTFTVSVTQGINLRTKPNVSSDVIAVIAEKQVINYDQYLVETNGYVWIRQPRGNGLYGYLVTGESKNDMRITYWGTFD